MEKKLAKFLVLIFLRAICVVSASVHESDLDNDPYNLILRSKKTSKNTKLQTLHKRT